MKNAIIKYFSKTVNADWLFFFRITVSAFCLLQFISILPDINNFIGNNAYVIPDIVDAHTGTLFPTINVVDKLLGNYFHVPNIVYWFSGVYIISLICLLLGFLTRPAAIVTVFLHIMFMSSIDFFVYGVDYFCSIALFYCVVFPVGKYRSIDTFIRIKRGKSIELNSNAVTLSLRVLQIHLCMAYFFGGLDKIIGFNWWNGESIWKSIHLTYCPDFINVDFLAHTPIFLIIGWGTIVTEMLYPIFMNIQKTRIVWLALVVCLHLSIALFIGLFFFSTFMIILSVSAFYMPYLKPQLAYVKDNKLKKADYANLVRQ